MIKAIAVFQDKKIKGIVRFSENMDGNVSIDIDIQGLKKNSKHGFHVHECGDMSDSCESMCAHFNPFDKNHGCPGLKERHVGDLGNIQADGNGNVKAHFIDDMIKLRGTKSNIIGRGLIIHEGEDDCGQTDHPLSKTTGNSGKRIACAVIGYAKPGNQGGSVKLMPYTPPLFSNNHGSY
jgi:Cu-Zn family superoxide dismutase